MAKPKDLSPSLLSPLIGWILVHALAAAGMFQHSHGTPLVAGEMEYRWFFVTIYVFAGVLPVVSFLRERSRMIPVTPTHTMAIAFGLYVFLIGTQIGLLPTDDVRLVTGTWAAIGGGVCLTVFNRRLQQARNAKTKIDEDEFIRRITAAIRSELQS
jgi:hypothetical protein